MISNSAEPIVGVDLFCGGGGLSEALAEAVEESNREAEQLVAVNHWEPAIESHKRNHPWADHYNAGITTLQPRAVVDAEDVDILTAGPECTHFSSARGGKPVDEQKRASPWHVIDWVSKLLPQNVLVENVRELKSWGPVIDGEPTRNGTFFEAWTTTLEGLGYSVAWRTLNAADHGDATSRRRLFVIARRDLQPVWPDATHSENGETPGTQPWRPAAEIIDWDDLGDSIWKRSRPLANTTMQRIAEGIRRFGDDRFEAFADAIAALEPEDVEALQDDIVPVELAPIAAQHRTEPFLVGLDTPVATPNTEDAPHVGAPYVLGQHSGSVPRNVATQPLPTIATRGAISLIEPESMILPRLGARRGIHSNPAYDPTEQSLHTVTAKNHDGHLVTPYLVPFYGEREGQRPRTHDVSEPLPTVTATGAQPAVTRPFIVQYNNNCGARSLENPLPTVTTRDRFGLVVPECYPWGIDVRFRMLQPRELAAAMGFPDGYEFVGTKTETVEQIGNAVPVNLGKALISQLLGASSSTLESFTDQPAEATG